jgi:hypothetical protein
MRAYCGQTREADLVAQLAALGIGECTVRGEVKSRRRDPWFYDNGAYRDWKAGKAFNAVRFDRDMRLIRYGKMPMPDFVVVPDIVAGGAASLAFSRSNRESIGVAADGARNPRAYLAVQDGMTVDTVRAFLDESLVDGHEYAGIFVGGSTEWKLATAAAWVEFAHATNRKCHIGRVGIPARVRWARTIGADSIDSCLPLMYEQHLHPFLDALAEAA